MSKVPFVALLLLLFTVSCEKEVITPAAAPSPITAPPPPPAASPATITYDKVGGYVQKGPFLNGTAMTISELDSFLVPTGKTFTTQLLDNRGTFAVRNVELESRYVQLQASGFYYNEVTDANSSAQLTLFALSDLSDKSGLNVNVLSSLEKGRVEYLLNEGIDFAAAKAQAQREILAIFEIEVEGMAASELLDISAEGEENAILLAVSVMLQGYLEVADFSELLANLSTDLREDGIVNSHSLGSMLVNNAVGLRPEQVRANLIARYEAMGIEVAIPDFEPYIANFLAKTDFEFRNAIVYPASGSYGKNVLVAGDTLYTSDFYSMAAVLPAVYQSLRVEISGEGWLFKTLQNDTGWQYSNLGPNTSRTFTTTRTGGVDFELLLNRPHIHVPTAPGPFDPGPLPKVRIALYENGATEARWIKEFTVQ